MRAQVVSLFLMAVTVMPQSQSRPRARDLGIAPGAMEPGPLNAITDVAGVLVGQTTVVSGDNVRTGVTAVLPHGGNLFRDKVAGAVFIGNAFGKLAGSTQVQELGTIESPIVLTNTLSVAAAMDATVRWTLVQPGNEQVRSVNAVIGETNDGGLNDIRGMHVTREHVTAAITGAKTGAVDEGAVGAGTGTVAFGWKGGIGTSSRRVRQGQDSYTIGVLVQTNYGGKLTIAGVPVWKTLTPRTVVPPAPSALVPPHPQRQFPAPSASAPRTLSVSSASDPGDGSCMIVVATDAPLDARDLQRLAARAIFAMARTGSTYSNGSGDFAIAFSTHPSLRVTIGNAPQQRTVLPTDAISGLFEATLDATEEAIYNSLLKAVDTTGNGRTIRALPVDELKALLKQHGR
ncbi:MAG: P1 family peptidase [Acidobacteria bacterium]|nr:P1 family peptidase [Acidobacteriota bacterium]